MLVSERTIRQNCGRIVKKSRCPKPGCFAKTIQPLFINCLAPQKKQMNKPSDRRSVFDVKLPGEVAELPEDLARNDPMLSSGGSRVETVVPERRNPHRVISTASYYLSERRRFGEGSDEFAEGLEAGDEMDDSSGNAP
jgi:hypothetical protein